MEYPLPYDQLHTLIDLIARRARCPLNFHGTPDENPRQWLGYLEDQLELTFSTKHTFETVSRSSSISRCSHSRSQSYSSEDSGSSYSSKASASDGGISIPLCQWPYVAVDFMRGEVMSETMRSVMECFAFADSGLVWDDADKSWLRESSTSRRQRLRTEWEQFAEVLCELHGKATQLLSSHKKLSLGDAYLQAASESTILEELGIPRPISPLTEHSSSSPSSTSLPTSLSRSLSSWLSLSTSSSLVSHSSNSANTKLAPKTETLGSSSSDLATPPSSLSVTAPSRLSALLPANLGLKPKILPSLESTASFAFTLGIGVLAFYGGHLHGATSHSSTSSSGSERTSYYSNLLGSGTPGNGSDYGTWASLQNLVSSPLSDSSSYKEAGMGTRGSTCSRSSSCSRS